MLWSEEFESSGHRDAIREMPVSERVVEDVDLCGLVRSDRLSRALQVVLAIYLLPAVGLVLATGVCLVVVLELNRMLRHAFEVGPGMATELVEIR
jgi:hypothetical protein